MEVLRRTARTFREECRMAPQNAKLFSDDVLLEVLAGDVPPRAKAVALAELAVRKMLSPRRYEEDGVRARFDVTRALDKHFGIKSLARFWVACERCAVSSNAAQAAERAFRCLDVGADPVGKLHALSLEAVLRPWLESDGVIPVSKGADAYLLPFSFCDRRTVGRPCVIDGAGEEISEWTGYFQKFADAEAIDKDVRVDIRLNANVSGTGNSLMLPVLMAWWRRKEELPRYNVLRFIATGAYEGSRLGSVDTDAKEKKVLSDVDSGLLVRPGASRQHGEIPVGVGRAELLQRLRALAEESYDCSVSYACSRLEDFERSIRERNWGEWSSLSDRLEHLLAGVTEKDPEERLWGIMLRSAAACHAGQTEQAHALNAQARELAAKMPVHRPQLLRLQIEELVILQDEEDFEKVYRLVPALGNEIDAFAVAEGNSNRAVDLQMRYWGTLGQFWLYDAVAHQDAALAKQARDALDRAMRHAQELYGRSRRANGGRADISAYANCAQDANYGLLWAAFFDRGAMTNAERRAREEAESLRNDGADEQGADKSDAFRWRSAALAKYRAVLARESRIPEFEEDADIEEMAESGRGWVAATACKYLGATAAFRGDGQRSREWFDCALAKMHAIKEGRTYYGLVMRVIHMTVFAEAYRSLRGHESQREFAQQCRTKALAFFDSDDAATWKKDDWKHWLASEADDESFPGKRYWY